MRVPFRIIILIIMVITITSCSVLKKKDQTVNVFAPCVDRNANYSFEDTQWLKQSASLIEIEALSNNGLVDASFESALQNVRFLGIGESVHGSHELSSFRIGLTEYLIRNQKFKIVSIELPLPYVKKLDEYIQGSNDKLSDLLTQSGAWVINSEEIFQFLTWARDYNSQIDLQDRIRLIGYDITINDAQANINQVAIFLHSIDRVLETDLVDGLSCLTVENGEYYQKPQNEQAKCRKTIVTVKDSFKSNRDKFIQLSSIQEYDFALKNVDLMLQLEKFYTAEPETSYALRDQLMFENLVWIDDAIGHHEDRIVVWGHNTHVGRNNYANTKTGTTGTFLYEEFAEKYYAIGSSFLKGSFTAIPLKESHYAEFPPMDSYEAFFTTVGFPAFFISLTNISTPAWFSKSHCLRNIGAYYNDLKPNEYFDMDQLVNEFDGFFFVEQSTPTYLFDPTGFSP
jgi:erythromycin esterase